MQYLKLSRCICKQISRHNVFLFSFGMNISEFSSYSLNEKGKKVFLEGKFIASREYYNKRLLLYDLGNFFAEVWYLPDEIKIHRIDAVSERDKRIDLYIHSNREKQ